MTKALTAAAHTDLLNVLADSTGLEFTAEGLGGLLTDELVDDLNRCLADTELTGRVLDRLSRILLERSWPLGGDRLTEEQRVNFFIDLTVAAVQQEWAFPLA